MEYFFFTFFRHSAKNAGKHAKTKDVCLASIYRALATRKVILTKKEMLTGQRGSIQTKDRGETRNARKKNEKWQHREPTKKKEEK